MARYIAFLRGLNVGGHNVKMDQLRQQFEALGFTGVSTFIASGNVLFESTNGKAAELAQRIEQRLREALGYEVATFLRTDAEVGRIAAYTPFPDAASKEGDTMYVIFLRQAPDAETRKRVLALANDQDLFHINGAELYWRRRGSLLEATINDAELAKALGRAPTTSRNMNTLRRLAAKYPPA